MKHTPGPWQYYAHKNGAVSILYKNGTICEIPGNRFTTMADGNLITAAPEMLETLESVDCKCSVKERESGHLTDCFMPSVFEVIKKARGEK